VAASRATLAVTTAIGQSAPRPSSVSAGVQTDLSWSHMPGQGQAGPIALGASRPPPFSSVSSTLPLPAAAAGPASSHPKLHFPTSLPKAAGPHKRQLPDHPYGTPAPLKKPSSGGALMNLPVNRRGFQPPAPSSTFKVVSQWSHRQLCWPERETLASLSSQGVGSAAPRSCKIPGKYSSTSCANGLQRASALWPNTLLA
jgi:hypothetical protein